MVDSENTRIVQLSHEPEDGATTTSYDRLGRPVAYTDADGNRATVSYDIDGRAVSTSDAKGSQTYRYDELSGVLLELEDSAAGVFTASYNADGSLIGRGLPDGLTAETAYNAAGEAVGLSYTKESYCGESCTWLAETLERSISGQILTESGTQVSDAYSYDHAGRLTEARETPAGGSCTTRAYSYDADSNRLSKATRAPGIGGVCVTSGGTEQKYSYDPADRLEGPTYDWFGRITSLPAEFAGGQTLTTTYFANEMVATQTQGAVTNSFDLDATGRQRARLQGGGGVEGTEIFHYDGSSDSVAWTERGSTWTRDIAGIGGELAAVQESGSEPTLQLTNLHGDVVATAEITPTATKVNATFHFDEFGNPMSGSARRFGWLGSKHRRTELSSGVIQMGARSYIPQLGRFLTPDPIRGGSANAYDYANQDPINNFDITGERCKDIRGSRVCKGKAERRELHRALVHAKRQSRSIERRSGYMAGCKSWPCRVGVIPPGDEGGELPFEKTMAKVAASAANFMLNHAPEVVGGSDGGLMGFLVAKYGRTEMVQGCEKSATDTWVETIGLWNSGPQGRAIAGGDIALNCVAGALF